MSDPATILAAVGGLCAAGACVAGAKARQAQSELVQITSPVGDALKRAYRSVVDEGVRPEEQALLDRLDAGEGGGA